MYSIVDQTSFMNATMILKQLALEDICSHYPVMLIGTKRDLSRVRTVNRKEAFDTANLYNCTQFDVSAASDKKVKDCFHALFRQIEVRRILHQADSDENKHVILNPPKVIRNGVVRYGTC